MKQILILVLLLVSLFSADINQTLVNETNATFYKTLLKQLDKEDTDYKLQTTLLSKIASTLEEEIRPFTPKDFEIKNEEQFIDLFYKINLLLAEARVREKEIEEIQNQLEDLWNDISSEENASLTLQLEYAYYEHQKRFNEKFVKYVNEHYTQWLDILLEELLKVRFEPQKAKKRIKSAAKEIARINKQLRKYQVELERWKILEAEDKAFQVQKKIDELLKKREKYSQEFIKGKLSLFFSALQQKDEKALRLQKEIVRFAQENTITPYLPESLELTLSYMLQQGLGNWKAYLLGLKEQAIAYLNNNSVIGIPLYKFAQGLGVFLIFLFLRRLFTFVVLRSVRRFVRFTKTEIDDNLIQIFEGPLKFTFIIIGFYFGLKIAGVENATSAKIMRSFIIFVVFWVLYNAVHVLDEVVYGFARKFGKELYREIGAFFIKTLKIFIFAVGLVSILQEWNINVSAFIASLGLGGLAFALAAKDTASNLFGGLSILADRALKIDDWIKVGDVEGTVEEIGLRTTKIRTFEKSLVTVPNQIIANNPIENFSRRSVRRIKMRIGVVYSTTQEQIQAIVKDIRKMLQHHPQISQKHTLLVFFDQFNDSDLSIFIYCFTNTANWAKYLAIREDINLRIMEIVQKHGSDFAFPSESIYVEKFPFELPTQENLSSKEEKESNDNEPNERVKPNLPKEKPQFLKEDKR